MSFSQPPLQKTGSEALKTVVSAFLCSRMICALFVYCGHYFRKAPNFMPGAWKGVENGWLNPWTTYDSVYYLAIAREGYQTLTSPFFPLYPIMLRLGGDSQTGMAIAGVLISNLAFSLALFFLYRLTVLDYGSQAARAAVWLLAFFPTGAFFSALYTESIFLLFLLLSFYAARKRRWLLAGLAGAFASLCRNPGLLIFAALGLEYFREQGYSLKRLEIPHLFFISLPLVSFVSVQAYLWETLGTPFASVAVQQQFYRAPTWPWQPIWEDVLGFFTYLDFDLVTFVNLLSIFLVVFLVFRYGKKLKPAYALLLCGLLLMNLAYALRIPPHTTGSVRYLSTAFPFLQLLGHYSSQPNTLAHRFRLAGTGLYIYIFLLFSFLFGLKSFLG